MKKNTILIFLCSSIFLQSQRNITLQEFDSLFQKNNILLLAEQYNISASKAAVIQAKIWDQPYISGEFNAYNPNNPSFFDIGSSGQKAIAVQQLIYLGGKKKKEVDLAKNNVELAALQYEQLLRNLKFEIHKNFYELYFNQKKINNLSKQLHNLDTLIEAYNVQVIKGNVPLKDEVRLQSLSLSLKNDMLEVQKNIFNLQENIKILTNISENFYAVGNEQAINAIFDKNLKYPEDQMVKFALQKNPEYLTTLKMIENNELMLQWQKSLNIPNITVGAAYDQRGGAFNNQGNLTFGMPLPLWSKNKGAIQMAESMRDQSKLLKIQKELDIKSKVSNANNTFLYYKKQYSQSSSTIQNFELVYKGILQNFQKRNVSLIEFTDFMESYNQSTMFIYEIKKQLIISGEMLNYITNENVY